RLAYGWVCRFRGTLYPPAHLPGQLAGQITRRSELKRRCAQAAAVRGFTLIELLVVIIILAILAAVVIPRFVGRTEDAKVSAAITQIKNLDDVLSIYNSDTGQFPPNMESLINN